MKHPEQGCSTDIDMGIPIRKEVLTTGEVARICHVAPRTVSKWFDTGKLRGYRIPGSRDRRIPLQQLLAFMRAHSIPLDALDGGTCRVMVFDVQLTPETFETLQALDRYEVQAATNGFEAGLRAQEFHPHVIVLGGGEDLADLLTIYRNIRSTPALEGTRVIAALPRRTSAQSKKLLAEGIDACIPLPFTADQLTEAVEEATNLVR